MKLEEGMYVRTKWGIAKIIDFEAQNLLIKLDKKIMYENLPEYYDYNTIADILKASHNIIDLIEKGDFVNSDKVLFKDTGIAHNQNLVVCLGNDEERHIYDEYCIKSIVTKEQFESMKYEVK